MAEETDQLELLVKAYRNRRRVDWVCLVAFGLAAVFIVIGLISNASNVLSWLSLSLCVVAFVLLVRQMHGRREFQRTPNLRDMRAGLGLGDFPRLPGDPEEER